MKSWSVSNSNKSSWSFLILSNSASFSELSVSRVLILSSKTWFWLSLRWGSAVNNAAGSTESDTGRDDVMVVTDADSCAFRSVFWSVSWLLVSSTSFSLPWKYQRPYIIIYTNT